MTTETETPEDRKRRLAAERQRRRREAARRGEVVTAADIDRAIAAGVAWTHYHRAELAGADPDRVLAEIVRWAAGVLYEYVDIRRVAHQPRLTADEVADLHADLARQAEARLASITAPTT